MRLLRDAGLSLPIALALALSARGESPRRAVDFNRDIRPILSETCFACHGPDRGKRKADLRLDTKEGLFASAVIAGKPDESDLYARLVTDDDDERMPPPKSGKTVTKAQAELIKRWIEEGAEWKGHWAYLAPLRPPLPVVEGRGFIRNDLDRFILEKLKERGLSPSAEADRVTLIRRLSVDLTGLPPTPAEVDAFVGDPSPDAYEALVDRLLASPHYGERMAIFWLDLVRYADTTGIHGDNHRDVSLYRDYVIEAFNENMPFDRFTTEQLAGDLLPAATDAQRVASGYNRMLMTTQEGGAQAKEYIAKYAADRVRNASSVWLGATLGCAECHDHKFDPFKTRDFYRFAAFFADLKEVAVGEQEAVRIPTAEQKAGLGAIENEMAPLRARLATPTPELLTAQERWERSFAVPQERWSVLRPAEATSKGGAAFKVLDDGSVLASGPSPESDTYTLKFESDRKGVTALRLEVLPDATLPGRGPGRAANGNFVLHELAATLGATPLVFSSVTATHSQDGWAVAGAADGQRETGWAVLPAIGRENEAVFETSSDVGPGTLTLTLRQEYGTQHTIGRFRVSTTSARRPVRAGEDRGVPRPIAEVLAVAPPARTAQQKEELAAHYRSIAPELEGTRTALAVLQRRKEAIENALPRTLVSVAVEPRMTRILPRGNWLDESGPVVTPAVPGFLSGREDPSRRATRLDLARWLVARENPLVARVFVNRLWKLEFGQGIVSTLEDFGAQGAWPTHHELLDWLAIEFSDGGWDVKRMVRLLVTSGTYRQSSKVSEDVRQRDPYNHWLARQGRFRLDAETVRDNALAVSGLLSSKVGGPSAKPYQPAGYWFHLNFPKREYQSDHGEGLYRRGLYTYWCRTFLHPSLLAFDAPSREECKVDRARSNTPLQALVLLNDPAYVEAARTLAERIVREGGPGVDSRLRWAFRQTLSRPTRPAEATVLATLLRSHLAQYEADPKAAAALIHAGERPVPTDLEASELAAWTSVARVLLNLHETITRD